MVTYRHKILLDKIKLRIKPEDIQNAKMILLFVTMFSIISFFGYRIIQTVNQGFEASNRIENIQSQVQKLEKENVTLKEERDTALSESEIEAQYRALGYKKPGEEVYIVSRQTPTPTEAPSDVQTSKQDNLSNWQKWLLLIFN